MGVVYVLNAMMSFDVLPFVCNMAASKVLSRLLGEEYAILIYFTLDEVIL